MMRTFKSEIIKTLFEMCFNIGFNKEQHYYVKPYSGDVTATLLFGLVTHSTPGSVYINVTVGMSYLKVERVFTQLTEANDSRFRSTINTNIGYLMPDNTFREWEVKKGKDNSKPFEDMFETIKIYGFDYYERTKDYQFLLEGLETRQLRIINWRRDRVLPILYYLNGEKDKGLQYINEAIERQKNPQDDGIKALSRISPEGEVIIGSGIGKVDLNYLKFAEKYERMKPWKHGDTRDIQFH